jgi:hypothetical protein
VVAIGWNRSNATGALDRRVSPGGLGDIVARPMGQWLSERLGQPFIIENRPGAAGLGTHPDIVEIMWKLDDELPQRCRWVFWGRSTSSAPQPAKIPAALASPDATALCAQPSAAKAPRKIARSYNDTVTKTGQCKVQS